MKIVLFHLLFLIWRPISPDLELKIAPKLENKKVEALPDLEEVATGKLLDSIGVGLLNIKYKTSPEKDLLLDIYYPADRDKSKKLPVIFYTHGGGWAAGTKDNIQKGFIKDTFRQLVNKGFAVVSVSYRLTKLKTVVMKDCVVDVMDAVRFISKNSETYGLDPNRVFVIGDSAGGQLAQMIVLADPSLFPGDPALLDYRYKVIAGVSWYGPSDFTEIELFETDDPTKNPDRFGPRIIGPNTDPSSKQTLYQEMSPVFYLTNESPPLYMMAADKDTTIPVAHAYHMKEKADEIGANVELFVVKNAGHNWRKAGGEIDPPLEVIVEKTIDFILQYKDDKQ
ncbi:alpha/beta hydrolase [Echinicola pacifica]|uniref:alpha/beta hydrolase n=1 Tax=Echinicola pacifica TaxID=346377 RepID=UPI0003686E49|nr:alpha/beta hydrolase [Echinicola pacifica]